MKMREESGIALRPVFHFGNSSAGAEIAERFQRATERVFTVSLDNADLALNTGMISI